jgi:predicted amidohydrolase
MAHWHTLLRARAIESQAFVFAAAQGGTHENGRETFGHSLIVSPWGELLAEAGVHPTVIVADVELQLLEDVRRRVPSLQHDRAFDVVHASQEAPDKVVP